MGGIPVLLLSLMLAASSQAPALANATRMHVNHAAEGPSEAVVPRIASSGLLEPADEKSVACGPIVGLIGAEDPESDMLETPLFINPGIGNGSFDFYGMKLNAYRQFEPVLTIRILSKSGREISKTVFENWIEDRGYMRLNDDILNFVQYELTDTFDRHLNRETDGLDSAGLETVPSRAVFEFIDKNGKAFCVYVYNYAASFH